MPIRITNYSNVQEGQKGEELAWLCDDDWKLPQQLEALDRWLQDKESDLKVGSYVADIGFSPREDAAGGGGVVSAGAMKIMAAIGMDLFLSEYPPYSGPEGDET